jgi:hypothetical protein
MQPPKSFQSSIRFACAVAGFIALSLPMELLADQLSDVEALEAQCAQDREAKIKPLRDIEIAKCQAQVRNDPTYCERFWSDYGNAVRRADGTMTARMFDDLPVCVAAFEARKALINRTDRSGVG